MESPFSQRAPRRLWRADGRLASCRRSSSRPGTPPTSGRSRGPSPTTARSSRSSPCTASCRRGTRRTGRISRRSSPASASRWPGSAPSGAQGRKGARRPPRERGAPRLTRGLLARCFLPACPQERRRLQGVQGDDPGGLPGAPRGERRVLPRHLRQSARALRSVLAPPLSEIAAGVCRDVLTRHPLPSRNHRRRTLSSEQPCASHQSTPPPRSPGPPLPSGVPEVLPPQAAVMEKCKLLETMPRDNRTATSRALVKLGAAIKDVVRELGACKRFPSRKPGGSAAAHPEPTARPAHAHRGNEGGRSATFRGGHGWGGGRGRRLRL